MENDIWQSMELGIDALIPSKDNPLQIPGSCTWCGKPGEHRHLVKVEGSGIPEKMRWIIMETYLCPECHHAQKKI